ncbi:MULTISPECIES: glycosyltransferase family 9 protein [Niastella]|uniref:Glycosyltransferase family 9 protein n=1 Tax=Niastella soli TaxID=2821487 RepID=A0ABS3YY23_9BACT|nr:glycosyltransferase family 9 protein [Niastella soli]MBO9202773.1 glycosyltransferase family 9 protein [Niastella soli]
MDKYLGYCLIGILLPVTRLLGIAMRRDHSLQHPPQHLLFIKLLGLGSLVVASDAIKAMRKKFPTTRFILLTDSNIASGIEPFHVFDEIWKIDTSSLSITISTSLKYIIRSWQLQDLWVADLEVYSKLTTVYSLLTMARNRFGFHLQPVYFRKFLNTHNIPFNQTACLEDNYCHLAQVITQAPIQPNFETSPVRANEWDKPYIILNNTCSSLAPVRKLPDETLAAICNWILTHTHFRIAFSGTQNDKAAIDQFIDGYLPAYKQKGKLNNIAGVLDLEAYYHFIADKGVCMVTIDSGPLHIARKLGLPTISIWGPTNPANYLNIPPGEKNRHLFLYNKVACSPCVHHHEPLPCGGNNFCMKDITASSITEKINGLLQHLQVDKDRVAALEAVTG